MLRCPRTIHLKLACIIAGTYLAALLAVPGPNLHAGEAALWGSLRPGGYQVGFKAFEMYDRTRTFQPKRDYFGEVMPGERARPIQVLLWYPAAATADQLPVVFSEYTFIPPEDQDFYGFLAGIQDREIGFLYQILRGSETAVLEALSTEMAAIRDAEPAAGEFPLLVYHSDFNRGIAENAVMCEYLASHGFVVATTHSFGLAAVRSEPDPAGIETMVGDMEFVISALHQFDFIDHDKLAAFGYRTGAVSALLLQMRSYDVDAVLGLESALRDSQQTEWAAHNPYYNAARMTVPLMDIHSAPEGEEETTWIEPLRYADRSSLGFRDTRGLDFTTYGVLQALLLPPDTAATAPDAEIYDATCRYVLHFLDAHLNGTEASAAFLARSPAENGLDPGRTVVARLDGDQRPPSPDEFQAILADGNVQVAVDLYDKFRALDPDLVLFREGTMNITGYRFLQRGMAAEAVAVFRMNADSYPRSANCWDSLAEAYIATGDNEHALECVQKVIEVLPTNTDIGDDLRRALEHNAQTYMEMLSEHPDEPAEE
jgi:tetratricopeptide (TPR) repeat protein